MKKRLLGTTIAVFTLTAAHGAYAQSNPNYQSDYSYGPYVGAYGGYGWTDGNNDFGGDVDVEGGDYGIYAGFEADALLDATINRTGLGLKGALEGYYGWSSADETVGAVSFEKENEWGFRFRPGLAFLHNDYFIETTPYAILGYRQTEYEVNNGVTSGDEDFHGFELGIGTELVAYDNVGIRLDYAHVFYGDEAGFDPDEDNIRLGVSYHF